MYMYTQTYCICIYIYSDNFGECSRIEERELFILGYSSGTPLGGSSTVCERNVLASNVFRLRCDSRRSFRRAIRGEFLDAAMFLSTRCFSRTFSRFGSEAGQFFSRLLVGHCHTERERGVGEQKGGEGRNGLKGTGTRHEAASAVSRSCSPIDSLRSLVLLSVCSWRYVFREKKPADVKGES